MTLALGLAACCGRPGGCASGHDGSRAHLRRHLARAAESRRPGAALAMALLAGLNGPQRAMVAVRPDGRLARGGIGRVLSGVPVPGTATTAPRSSCSEDSSRSTAACRLRRHCARRGRWPPARLAERASLAEVEREGIGLVGITGAIFVLVALASASSCRSALRGCGWLFALPAAGWRPSAC